MTPALGRVSEHVVLNSLHEPIFVADPDGTLVYANQRLSDVTRLPAETLVGSPVTRLLEFTDEGFDSLQSGIEAVIRGDAEERRVDLSMILPESAPVSRHVPAEARLTQLTDDEGLIGALVVLRDITERKGTEHRLRESERRFRTMFESHSAPMLLIEPESGAITEANAAAVEFYGYAESALTDMTIQQINRLSPEEVASERDRAARQNRNHFVFEHELASGEVRTVEVHSTPIDVDGEELLFSIIHDITERKESQHELQLFKAAVGQTGHAVIITDDDGIIEYVNPAFEADTGYASEDAVGRTPRFLKSGKQNAPFYEDLWDTILSGDVWEAELVNRRKSGELYYVEQTIAPITDDDGEITNFVAVQSDITERKLREKRLSDLNRILRHNLRNSLTAIEGYTRELIDAVGPEHRSWLERILTQADTLATTSEKITTVRQSLDSAYDIEATCDLGTLLSRLDTELAEEYPDASVQIEPAPAAVEVDAATCRTLLTELIDNAIVHNDRETPRIMVSAEVPDDPSQHVSLRVADNGPGIPAQERTAIEVGADDPLTHSSGVGLAHVHWLVINYGGDVTITDNEPRGSVVTVSLPRAGD